MDHEQFYYQARPQKAADFRRVAREALKKFWWMAALVTLLASVLGGVAVGGGVSLNTGGTSIGDIYAPDMDMGDYEETMTPEEEEMLEQEFENLDFESFKEFLGEEYPVFNVIIFIIVIAFIVGLVLALAFSIFVSSPVKVGYQRFCLEVLDGNESEIRVGTLFNFFKQSYFKTIGLNIVHTLLMELTWIPMLVCMVIGGVSFASSLLPMLYNPLEVSDIAVMGGLLAFVGLTFLGMVISLCINLPIFYMYSMAHIIMADYPSVGAIEALRLSRQMMKGNKWRLFCLNFSFIGWALLAACCTCGIGYYFLTPYQYVANAAFYHEISGRKTPEDIEVPDATSDGYTIE